MASVGSQIAVTLEGPLRAARGRRTVQQLLGEHPSIRFIRDAILVTGELVTTATTETGQCELTATYDGERLRVEVADVAARMPVPPDERDVGGAALSLVSRIVTRWGTGPVGERAVLWFEMDECAYQPSTPSHA